MNGEKLYTAMSVGNKEQSLESRTEILGGYCIFETPQSEKEQETHEKTVSQWVRSTRRSKDKTKGQDAGPGSPL